MKTQLSVKFLIMLLLTASLAVMSGCGEEQKTDKDTDTSEAPQLPPESTMVMDFSDFDSSSNRAMLKSVDTGSDPYFHNTADPQANYKWAAFTVGVWNTIIYLNGAIPVAAFRESFNHLPRRQSDGTWVWSYTVTVANVVYVATLKGKVVSPNVEWNMYLTREGDGGFTDFNWFSGVSALDRSEGSWSLNMSPDSPTPFVDIVWHWDAAADTFDVRFTNVIPGHSGENGYIEYAVTGASPYDAHYYIDNTDTGNYVQIEWNRTSKEGRISDPKHYVDVDTWHYWDSSRNDIPAP